MSELLSREEVHGRFECDSCGECCRRYVVSVTEADIEREPRLKDAVIPLPMVRTRSVDDCREYVLCLRDRNGDWGKVEMEMNQGDTAVLAFAGDTYSETPLEQIPCAFLENGRCAIQTTKPDVCYVYEPGGDRCQGIRLAAGLAELQPDDCMHQVVTP